MVIFRSTHKFEKACLQIGSYAILNCRSQLLENARRSRLFFRPFMTNYKKNDHDLFEKIDSRRKNAKLNSRKLLKQQRNDPHEDPYTNMHELIEYLEKSIPFSMS